MMCVLHQCEPYGHLSMNGNAMNTEQLARVVGDSPAVIKKLLAELEAAGVFSRNEKGCIYSRRMVKDERVRNARSDGGKLGGNPDLGANYNIPGYVYLMERSNGDLKIGISQSPEKRAYKLRVALSDDSVKVIAKSFVEDMGKTESELHEKYKEYSAGGEWFTFTHNEREEVIHLLNNLKVNDKANNKEKQTPSSSSSSTDIKTLRFAQFWTVYPKKKSKGSAEKAFNRISPDEPLFNRILAAVESWKKSPDWQRENGQFIPYPASWLNAKGWEDEISAIAAPKLGGLSL